MNPLDYDPNDPAPRRNKLLRTMFVVIAAKVALVVVNVLMAFADIHPLPRLLGVGAQLVLTVVFLVVLMRLTTGGPRR